MCSASLLVARTFALGLLFDAFDDGWSLASSRRWDALAPTPLPSSHKASSSEADISLKVFRSESRAGGGGECYLTCCRLLRYISINSNFMLIHLGFEMWLVDISDALSPWLTIHSKSFLKHWPATNLTPRPVLRVLYVNFVKLTRAKTCQCYELEHSCRLEVHWIANDLY